MTDGVKDREESELVEPEDEGERVNAIMTGALMVQDRSLLIPEWRLII